MDNRSSSSYIEHRAELEQARSDIKNAYQAGLFLGGVNFIFFLAVVSNPAMSQKLGGGWILLDVIVFFGLSYGIYCKNRACAILMMCYVILARILSIAAGDFSPFSIILTGILLRCFFQGIVGTANYHTLQTMGDNSDGSLRNASYPDNTAAPDRSAVEKFWVGDRLVELCNGDRSQAEWLLHQLRRKHPDRSMNWYNDRAVAQLSSEVGAAKD
jgi:hypothetical protein